MKIKLGKANIPQKYFILLNNISIIFSDLQNITDDMLCADVLEEGSFCIGDGGGPLVTMNDIVSEKYSLEKYL